MLAHRSINFATRNDEGEIVRVGTHRFFQCLPRLNGLSRLDVSQCEAIPAGRCLGATFSVCRETDLRHHRALS